MVKDRIEYVDKAKAVAIILVVLGHSIQYLSIDVFQDNLLFNFIYAFHMPLFMLMSGLFFEHTLRKNFWEMLSKKCQTLLLPSIVWTLPSVFYFLVTNKLNLIWWAVIHNVWFLKSVFLCYMISYVVYKALPFRYACIVLMLLALCLPLAVLPGNLNSMLPYFVAGIVINRFKKELIGWKYLPLSSCVLFLLLFCFWKFDYNKYVGLLTFENGLLNADIHSFCIYLYRFAIGLCGSLCVISLCAIFDRTNDMIIWLGRHTLEIYVLNGLVSISISHMSIHLSPSGLCDLVAFLLTTSQVYCLYFIIKRISTVSWLRLVLFGKRTCQ